MNLLQIPLAIWGESCSLMVTLKQRTEPLKCESPKLVPLPCDSNNGFNGVWTPLKTWTQFYNFLYGVLINVGIAQCLQGNTKLTFCTQFSFLKRQMIKMVSTMILRALLVPEACRPIVTYTGGSVLRTYSFQKPCGYCIFSVWRISLVIGLSLV
jgi:hypothetical protein